MAKKKLIRAIALIACGAVSATCLSGLFGCAKKQKDSIVLMTEELTGLFNPFYATAGTDMDVVGFTQLGMLTYDADDNGNVTIAAGDDYAVVCKDYMIDESKNDETTYKFVIKNDLKFSDGVPLTMNDVMFNIYEYLDPVYTGSSTMYSVKIKGLNEYRTQQKTSGGGTAEEDSISQQALTYARTRRQTLIDLYTTEGKVGGSDSNSYSLTEEKMKDAIANKWDVNTATGYKRAVAADADLAGMSDDDFRAQLLADYELVLKTHKEEIEGDFKAAKDSFDTTLPPYDEWKNKLESDIFKFFLYEGYITPKYAKEKDNPSKDDYNKILSFSGEEYVDRYPDEADAIQRVYSDNITSHLNDVLSYWGTAGTVLTEFTGAATEIVIKNTMETTADGKLKYPNIEGVVSLGHTKGYEGEKTVTITRDGATRTYNVAHEHNEDGTPVKADEYDVLQITIEGKDPKAIYNFGFSVAPAHYYTADETHPNGREIDIADDKFGVEYASSSFQGNTIKSLEHLEIPLGAGPYKASDRNNSDSPTGGEFSTSNIVYYKANPNFLFPVKTEKLRLQVVRPADALDVLQSGEVDYVVPQFTKTNADRLDSMESSGFKQMDCWQLGYGYIGINAGKVPDVNIRMAIMSAMQTSLALTFYKAGTCKNIDWPMSMMSWAYPYEAGQKGPDGGTSKQNGHDYTQWTTRDAAIEKIKRYTNKATNKDLKITFTIAGSSITEHPTYEVFKQARELLNECGWNVTVKADRDALTKLATGSLAVWAAAWGSTIDPDMYQVYHKNSTATSVYAWGYREIMADTSTYSYENSVISELSGLIDDAREITDQTTRAGIYEEAMGLVLDLAVEMPVYQRKNLYAYNANTVKGFAEHINAYTSPLDKVWELELI